MPDVQLERPPGESYSFVSYSHEDEDIVTQEIQRLQEQGFRLWYDAGIRAGERWREELARALEGARLFVFFVSPHSVRSTTCLQEAHYAADLCLPILPVYLEPTELPRTLRLALSDRQALHLYRQQSPDRETLMSAAISRLLDATDNPVEPLEGTLSLRKDRIHIAVHADEADADAARLATEMIRYLSWQGGVYRPHFQGGSPPARSEHIDYQIQLKFLAGGEQVRIVCIVRSMESGEVLWTLYRDEDAQKFEERAAHLCEILGEGALNKVAAKELQLTQSLSIEQLGYGQLIIKADQLTYLSQESQEETHRVLKRAVHLEPSSGLAYASRASLLAWELLNLNIEDRRAHVKKIEDAVRAAARLDPDDPFVLFGIGTALCRIGRYERGLKLLRRSCQMAPTVRAKSELARSLCFAGLPEEAVPLFEEVLSTLPSGQRYPYARVAVAYTQMGSFGEALMHSRDAVAHFPDDFYGWLVHCNVLRQLGEVEASLDAFEEAKRLLPKLDLERAIERTAETYGRTVEQVERLTGGLRQILQSIEK